MTGVRVGIDIGKSNYRVGILSDRRELTHFVKVAYVPDGVDGFVAQLAKTIDQSLDTVDAGAREVECVGIGLPGIVERTTGKMRFGPDFDFMTGVSIGDCLNVIYGWTPTADVDTIIATWGELCAGVGVKHKRIALLTWGTSLGAGLVLDGKVMSHPDDLFPEFGHSIVSDSTRPCICGGIGCVAAMVSGPGIAQSGQEAVARNESAALAEMAKSRGGVVTTAMVFEAFSQGDHICRDILDRVAVLFGRLCANIVYYCQPSHIVITGGLAPRFDSICERVGREMNDACWLLRKGFTRCEVVASALNDTAGVIGAAAMAAQKRKELCA